MERWQFNAPLLLPLFIIPPMKKSPTQALGFCAALLLLVSSCKKDEVQTVIQPGAAPTLTSSTNSLVLLQTNSSSKAATYTWTPVSFGYQAVVSYTLQFDKKGGDFSAPVSFDAGASTTKTLTVADLNSVYQATGLVSATASPVAIPVDARVVASVGATAPQVASAATTFMGTPYSYCEQPAKAWSIIGDALSGWSTDIVMTYDCVSKTYLYKGPIKAMAGTNAAGYKFRFNNDWTANLGGTAATGGTLTQGGPNLSVVTDGIYTIVLTPGAIDATGKATDGTFTIK